MSTNQNTINLKEKNVTELKALAYDLSEVVQQYSNMLSTVNGEIQARKQTEQGQQAKAKPEPTPQQSIPFEESGEKIQG